MTLEEAKAKIESRLSSYKLAADRTGGYGDRCLWLGRAQGLDTALIILASVEPVSQPSKPVFHKSMTAPDGVGVMTNVVAYGYSEGWPSGCVWMVPGTLDPEAA